MNCKGECEYEPKDFLCNGQCQSVDTPCNGTCYLKWWEPDCNGKCEVQAYHSVHLCNGKCLPKNEPCNGTCVEYPWRT